MVVIGDSFQQGNHTNVDAGNRVVTSVVLFDISGDHNF